MVAKQQKRRTNQRKLQFMRNLTNINFNCYDPNTVIKDALVYITMLKLKIEALQREFEYSKMVERGALDQIKGSNECEGVKVEKIGERYLLKVKCPREGHMLVNILEALEGMRMNVVEARVSCQDSFAMEAIVVPREEDQEEKLGVDDMTQSLVEALGKPSG